MKVTDDATGGQSYGSSRYECPTCGRSTKAPGQPRGLECPTCGRMTSQPHAVERIQRFCQHNATHVSDGQGSFVCPICGGDPIVDAFAGVTQAELDGKQAHAAKRTFRVGDAVQTRDGRKARIICDDMRSTNGKTLIVLVECDGHEEFASFFPDGRFYRHEDIRDDLFPAPRKREVEKNASTNLKYMRGPAARLRIEVEEGRYDP